MKNKGVIYFLTSVIFLGTISCTEIKEKQLTIPLEDGTTFYFTNSGEKTNDIKLIFNKTFNDFYHEINIMNMEDADVLIQGLTINEQDIENYYVWEDNYWYVCDTYPNVQHKEHYPERYGDKIVSECPARQFNDSYSMNKDLSVIKVISRSGYSNESTYIYKK